MLRQSKSRMTSCAALCWYSWMTMPSLSATVTADSKRLVEALSRRFASNAGEAELRFQMGQRCQLPSETLDQFADSLVDLTNRAYPSMDPTVRIGLARDRFIAGVQADANIIASREYSLSDWQQSLIAFVILATAASLCRGCKISSSCLD